MPGGRRFAYRPLNPRVVLKTQSTSLSTDPCTPEQLLPLLRRVYWLFHRRHTPTQPCHSTYHVLGGAGAGPVRHLGLRDSPPQAISGLVPTTVSYQGTVLILHEEQKYPSALQGNDHQLHHLALKSFDGPSLGER